MPHPETAARVRRGCSGFLLTAQTTVASSLPLTEPHRRQARRAERALPCLVLLQWLCLLPWVGDLPGAAFLVGLAVECAGAFSDRPALVRRGWLLALAALAMRGLRQIFPVALPGLTLRLLAGGGAHRRRDLAILVLFEALWLPDVAQWALGLEGLGAALYLPLLVRIGWTAALGSFTVLGIGLWVSGQGHATLALAALCVPPLALRILAGAQ